MSAIAGQLRLQHPETNENTRATVQSFNDWATGANVQLAYLTLAGAVAFVLLIACANVANLLIARSAQRAHEFAIRLAQGATRWQIVRQLSVENLVLGAAGGLVGLAVAAGGVRLAELLTRDMGMPPWMAFTIDPPVIAFFMGLCAATTLLFGLAPLLHLVGTPAGGLLQEGGRSGTQGVRARRLSAAMLVVEATLALVLLAGTGLLLRSLDKIHRIDLGFDLERVLYGEVALPSRRYAESEERVRFVTQLEERLNASPGVRAASVVTTRSTAMLAVDGRPTPEEPPTGAFVLGVGPRYFESLGARVLRGRGLAADDGRAGSEAAVVNARFVELFFDGEDPLGRRIHVQGRDESMGPWLTRLEFELIDRVRLWWGLVGTIHHFRGSFDRGPVLDGIWGILQNESYSDIRFFFSRSRQASIQRWRDYAWTETHATEEASDGGNPDVDDGGAR